MHGKARQGLQHHTEHCRADRGRPRDARTRDVRATAGHDGTPVVKIYYTPHTAKQRWRTESCSAQHWAV